MDIFQAFKALDEGKAVKRLADQDVYFQIQSPSFKDRCIENMSAEKFDKGELLGSIIGNMHFTREEIVATDWIVYQRPSERYEG